MQNLRRKQNSSNSNTTDISDGTKTTDVTGKTGTPVYYVSNLHAGKDFYLDSLKENYQLSFSDDFSSVMDEIEKEYKEKNKLTDASDSRTDGMTTSADSLLVRNWQDILAIYVYEQSQKGTKEFKLDSSSKDELAEIFAKMNPVVRDKENITHVSYGNYHINTYIKQNNIAQDKRTVLKKYTETDCKLLCAIVTDAKGFVRQSVGDDVSEERVNVITAAYSLVGEVGYFWGGKSTTIGKDPSWGNAEKVSAAGSPSTGTTRAYGLDCSGFVTWQSSMDMTAQIWKAVLEMELLISGKGRCSQRAGCAAGDLVFQNGPESGSNNHVGIICGKTDAGDWIAVHCSSSKNGVTVGEAYGASFRYIRQPSFYPTQEELAQMVSDGTTASNAEALDTAADVTETSDGDFTANTETKADTKKAEESSEDTSGIDISFEDDVEAGTEDAGLSDGITSGSTTVEVTGTLKEILEKGMTVSSGSAAIYPQQPDNSDIQVEFED